MSALDKVATGPNFKAAIEALKDGRLTEARHRLFGNAAGASDFSDVRSVAFDFTSAFATDRMLQLQAIEIFDQIERLFIKATAGPIQQKYEALMERAQK